MFLDLIPLHALQVCFVRARGPHSSEAGFRPVKGLFKSCSRIKSKNILFCLYIFIYFYVDLYIISLFIYLFVYLLIHLFIYL